MSMINLFAATKDRSTNWSCLMEKAFSERERVSRWALSLDPWWEEERGKGEMSVEGCRLSVSVHSNWDWSTLAYYFPQQKSTYARNYLRGEDMYLLLFS